VVLRDYPGSNGPDHRRFAAMRWVTYRASDGTPRVGLVDRDTVRALGDVRRLNDLLGDDGERLAQAAETAVANPHEVVPLKDQPLLAPIQNPPSIRDFMAFEEHVLNTRKPGQAVEPLWYQQPAFYFSNPAAIRGPHDEIPVSPGCHSFDYEVEVAAVVGRGGSDLHPDRAEGHIAGYMILVDWSARDLQRTELALRLGPAKGKDSATTLGPYLVTPDELEPLRSGRGFELDMTAQVNGKLYSRGNWADIYWSFGEMLAYASRGTELLPGDIIGSGTVGTGCILELSNLHGSDAYPWLVPGDRVELAVELLGQTTTHIIQGKDPIPLRQS
jgi:2-keto-4-pentenoate hydratase/2-oxohepta-3-ene-1,7-dioic acid hydratase in catechol pathway